MRFFSIIIIVIGILQGCKMQDEITTKDLLKNIPREFTLYVYKNGTISEKKQIKSDHNEYKLLIKILTENNIKWEKSFISYAPNVSPK